jgi:hypothetical protein
MYYIYRIEGIKNNYNIEQLKSTFYKNNQNDNTSDYNTICNTSINNNTISNINETVKCDTCNPSNINTPEKQQINQYNYIFDLHHLPIFDENTGEFLWSNDKINNINKIKENIFKSEEFNTNTNNNSINSINHGSLISLTSSFLKDNNRITEEEDNYNNKTQEDKWRNFKKQDKSGTFVEEINQLLKNLEDL